MAKTTPLALAVLELLAERDMHPYEMRQLLFQRRRDVRMKITAGSLYHSVQRLTRNGLIEVVETSREGRRPERTVYAITEAGRDTYLQGTRELLANRADEYPLYGIGLAFMHNLTMPDALKQLRTRRIQLEAHTAGLAAVAERLTADKLDPTYWIDMQHQRAMARAELDWTTGLIEDIEAGRLAWHVEDEGQ